MASDAREFSQSVNDQNEYHNLMTQIDTNVYAIKNALSGFSIPCYSICHDFRLKSVP